MELFLLDWTRMGRSYCLAGIALEKDRWRVVRPLLAKNRGEPARNFGWSAYLLDGHARWEVFELAGLEEAAPQPPHLEDVWVRSLRPRGRSAPVELRRWALQATLVQPGQPPFGEHLQLTHASAFLPPGHGLRSLATLAVPTDRLAFSASRREGAGEPEVRVALHVPPLDGRLLPMKDHHLLFRTEQAGSGLTEQVQALQLAVRQMGAQVAVRLGLSRSFQSSAESGEGRCWLMVDGIFSLTDPQS